jgi:hypothetical protein
VAGCEQTNSAAEFYFHNIEERRSAYRILVGTPEGRKPLGRLRRRWEDKLKWIIKKLDGEHGLD